MKRLAFLLLALLAACDTGSPAGVADRPPTESPTLPPGASFLATGPGEVLTSKNDNGRTGAQLAETVITRENVGKMALAATLPVDGELYAQPLVAEVGGRALVLAATMNDSVYAYDLAAPDGSPPVWHAVVGRPGASFRNVTGPNGILSTPVVDRARGRVWVVARDCSATEKATFDRCGAPTQAARCAERLVSIALDTGAVVDSVAIAGSVWTDAREVRFDPTVQWNRPALLLAGDALFVGFGSGPNVNDHEEDYEYHGWMFRYDVAAPTAPPVVWNSTPRTSGGSIWQAGAGPAADDAHVYFVTANDVLGCSTHAPSGFPRAPLDAEDSIVRLGLAHAGTDLRGAGSTPSASTPGPFGSVADYGDARVYSDTRAYRAAGEDGTVFQFTNAGDCGFGSSGPTLLPDSRDLVVGSKAGLLYLLDRDTMQARQAPLSPFDALPLQGDHSLYVHSWWGIPFVPGSLAFFRADAAHGLVYAWPKEDRLRSFRYDYAGRTLAAERAADVTPNDQGGYLAVSANGAASPLLWATTTRVGGGRIVAFDALDLRELWSAATPAFSKFTPPTVARGRVLVPSARTSSPGPAVLVYAPYQ